eukprot:2301522-Rhodomonas_salina.1
MDRGDEEYAADRRTNVGGGSCCSAFAHNFLGIWNSFSSISTLRSITLLTRWRPRWRRTDETSRRASKSCSRSRRSARSEPSFLSSCVLACLVPPLRHRNSRGVQLLRCVALAG